MNALSAGDLAALARDEPRRRLFFALLQGGSVEADVGAPPRFQRLVCSGGEKIDVPKMC